MTDRPAVIDADELTRLIRPRDAVAAVEAALRGGVDPAADPARVVVPVTAGQVLVMPAESGAWAGVKVVTVAPANAARDLPRVQGVYLLLDAATLTPVAMLDGAALTAVRTPAVSVAAVRPFLLRGTGPVRLVVFGAGPQAVGHVATIVDVLDGHRPVAEVSYLGRRPRPTPAGHPAGVPVRRPARTGAEAVDAVAEADVVVCATTARTPLFAGAAVRDDAVVIAVGSHEPDAREVDGDLAGRAHVIVEDVGTALREAGDVVRAVAEGRLTADDLVPMAAVVTGARRLPAGRPVFFKSTGMAWEDLAVAAAVERRRRAVRPD